MAAGVAHIPWYATTFRGDEFAAALEEVAPIARRYGATSWSVQRSTDDAYQFRHMISFDSKADWELFWNGSEMQTFRAHNSGTYQAPIMYTWFAVVTEELGAATPSA